MLRYSSYFLLFKKCISRFLSGLIFKKIGHQHRLIIAQYGRLQIQSSCGMIHYTRKIVELLNAKNVDQHKGI